MAKTPDTSVILRSPKVTVNGPWEATSADEMTVKAEINMNPTASFTAFSGEEAGKAANQVFSSDAASLMGQAQQLGFSTRSAPDTTITLDDGANTSVTMQMFLTCPTFMMNSRTIRPAFSAVAASAMMNNLKLDIYTTNTARNLGADSPLSRGLAVLENESKAQNLAVRLKELTEAMIKYWSDNSSNKTGKSTRIKKQRDEINQSGPLKQWYTLLENSVKPLEKTGDWIKTLTADEAGMNQTLNTTLLSMLRGSTRDFQEMLDQLCATFQLVLIPDKTGVPGYLARIVDLLEAEPKDLTLPASSVVLNGNSSGDLLTVQQVLIRGLTSPIYDTSIDPGDRDSDSDDFFIGGFPAEVPSASGEVVILPLPAFLQQYVLRMDAAKKARHRPTFQTSSPGFLRLNR